MTPFERALVDLAETSDAPTAPIMQPEAVTMLDEWFEWLAGRQALVDEYRAHRGTEPTSTIERWAVARAHHGLGYGMSNSGEHLVVLRPLKAGRLVRDAGDALCKPARKFWNLDIRESAPNDVVTCVRCKRIAERFGVDLIRPSEPREWDGEQ